MIIFLSGCDERLGCSESSSPKVVEPSQRINLGTFKIFIQFKNVGNSINFSDVTFDDRYFKNVRTSWNSNTIVIQGKSIKLGQSEFEIFVTTESEEFCEEEGVEFLNVVIE